MPAHDLIGRVFRHLTVARRETNNTSGSAMWLCLCACGERSVRRGSDLRAGRATSCGCRTGSKIRREHRKEPKTRVTADLLRELISYDPQTGSFVWNTYRSSSAKAGAECGYLNSVGYRIIVIRYVNYQASRLAWLYMKGEWPIGDIDHIDGIKDNNRLSNLRDVPECINMQNLKRAKKNSSTGLLGVSPFQGMYQSRIYFNGKKHYLGSFATPEEAHRVYLDAKRQHHAGCTI